MAAYLTLLGVASVGFGLFMLISPSNEHTPLIRLLAAFTVTVLLIEPLTASFDREDFRAAFFSSSFEDNAHTAEGVANTMVMECYEDKLSAFIKERAGEKSVVEIMLEEDGTVQCVTVYKAERIVGLREYITETLAPKEVLIYGKNGE